MSLTYALLLFGSAAVSAAVGVVAFSRRRVVGARWLVVLMSALTVWSLTYALRWIVTDPGAQLFWLDATYLGVVLAPSAVLVFILELTGNEHRVTRRTLAVLAVEPLLTLAILWSDPLHGFMYGGERATGAILSGGPWFWFNAAYSYALQIVAVVLLLRALASSHRLQRQQMQVALLGLLLPFVVNVASVTGIMSFGDLDPTPFVFVISGSLFAVGLFRYGLLDLVPIARDRLFEMLPDGVVVVDARGRVVDVNPAATLLTGISEEDIGSRLDALAPELAVAASDPEARHKGLELSLDPSGRRTLEIHTTPVSDGSANPASIVTARDITDRKLVETALDEYRTQLEEISVTDDLTGIANRRKGLNHLRREFQAFIERRAAFVVIIIDIDHFKRVNDTFGHTIGDVVLVQTARRIRDGIRGDDLLSRTGGEEFMVVTKDASLESATSLAERVRLAVAAEPIEADGHSIALTVSAGVTVVRSQDASIDEVISRADAAMYAAKQAGRNRVSGH